MTGVNQLGHGLRKVKVVHTIIAHGQVGEGVQVNGGGHPGQKIEN